MAWSADGQRVLICSTGMGSVLMVIHVIQEGATWSLQPAWQQHPSTRTELYEARSPTFEMAEFLPDGSIAVVKNQKKVSNKLVLVSPDGATERSIALAVLQLENGSAPDVLMMTPCQDGLLAVLFESGLACTVNTKSFSLIANFKLVSFI